MSGLEGAALPTEYGLWGLVVILLIKEVIRPLVAAVSARSRKGDRSSDYQSVLPRCEAREFSETVRKLGDCLSQVARTQEAVSHEMSQIAKDQAVIAARLGDLMGRLGEA